MIISEKFLGGKRLQPISFFKGMEVFGACACDSQYKQLVVIARVPTRNEIVLSSLFVFHSSPSVLCFQWPYNTVRVIVGHSCPFLPSQKGRVVPPGFWKRHSKGRLSWSDDYQGGCLAEYYEVSSVPSWHTLSWVLMDGSIWFGRGVFCGN